MAIVCVSTITPVDIPNNKVKVSAVITFDEEPPITVTMERVDTENVADKKIAELLWEQVAGTLWKKFVAKRNAYLEEQAFSQGVANTQDSLNTDIEGRMV